MIVEDIEPIPQAMDKSFRYAGDQGPLDFHLNLQLPGIFKELLQNDTVVDPKQEFGWICLNWLNLKVELRF